MVEQVTILGFVGSLRKGSYNKALMQNALKMIPENASLEVFGISKFPLFNQDRERTPPDVVKEFKAKIQAADAILIASPEYNYSIPGVLKNAIDWASRPAKENAFSGKPVAVLSASTSRLGGARMQYHLRQSFVWLNMYPINHPEFMLGNAAAYFDAEGNLTDEKTRQLLRDVLEALVQWTLKLKEKPQQP